jgi:rhamnosyltransferase
VSGNKILGFLTAFHDSPKVQRNLLALLSQSRKPDEIYVVDNSTVSLFDQGPLRELLAQESSIKVIHRPENIGIASALVSVQHYAIERGFDWIWYFDQDSVPTGVALETLLAFFDSYSYPAEVGVLASLPVDPEYGVAFHGIRYNGVNFTLCSPAPEAECYECDVVITAGTLASVRALAASESVDERYFIDAVDYDFCLKIRRAGFKVVVVQKSIIHQPIGEPSYVNSWLLKRNIRCSNHSALRRYYIMRNNTFLELSLCQADLRKVVIKWRLRVLADTLLEILHEKKDRFKKLYLSILGFWHGFQGRLGKFNS